jgi:hypothetical protein
MARTDAKEVTVSQRPSSSLPNRSRFRFKDSRKDASNTRGGPVLGRRQRSRFLWDNGELGILKVCLHVVARHCYS